jgi:hypothetical protein
MLVLVREQYHATSLIKTEGILVINYFLTFVSQFCRKKWIQIWMVPHPCDPSCCDWFRYCWLYILQIQASGMLHAFNIWTSFFLSIMGYWFVSLLARNDVIIQHFLFPIAVLHGLRDHGYHVAIHATWQQPEQWSFNRSPATTAWHDGVR